ncbi:MAG TPA: TIM barrel protein [Dehalococcoidia bacterium]|nr:TIM barrel protein [Dehalococcoidia bacterium]
MGNAPCSWGIMGGFELDPMPTYREVIDGIAASGFAGTELGDWGFMSDGPEALGRELASRRLQMIGAFTPVWLSSREAHDESEKTALRTARLLRALCDGPSHDGGPFVILAEASTPERMVTAGRVGPEHGMGGDQWSAMAAGAERIAARVRDETGLPTVFHHHAGTPVETLEETARLLEMTDPALIGLCYDSGHFAYAGADPLDALRRFGDRTWHVHFKDFRPEVAVRARREGWDYHHAVKGGLFCELGGGGIDFPALLEELRAMDYRGWIVVEDEMPPGACDPLENAKHDRSYLRGLGL